jgi:gas vesicle protein
MKMPAKKTRNTGAESQPEQSQSSGRYQAGEDYMTAWMSFAKEMGDTAEDFVKRFGEEQQKNYDQWVATVQNGTAPRPSLDDIKEVGERFQQWTGLAQQIGQRIKESFTTGTDLQKEFFTAWSQASRNGSSPEEISKRFSDLAQRFWAELGTNLYQKSLSSMHPEFDLSDVMKSQRQTMNEFNENFKKISPPFVTLFGQTLQSTLEIQKLVSENIWNSVRMMTSVGEEATALIQRLYETTPSFGQMLKMA